MNMPLKYVFLMLLTSTAGFSQHQARSPLVDSILGEISPDRMRASVQKLVGFGTRHTLSDTASQTRGIGAARRWIMSEFRALSAGSHGRLRAEYQSATVPASRRVPHETRVVNVVATLQPRREGSSSLPDRILALGAHYDSRSADPMDSTGDSPGADDDASGVALVLELARVLSQHSFRETIVFLCFAGEEQGLLGAGSWAEAAKDRGLVVEAMLNNDMVGNITSGDGLQESTYVRVFSQAFSPADTGAGFLRRNSLGLENDGSSRSLARLVEDIARRYLENFRVEMVYRQDRFLRGGDHVPFHQKGYAAVRLCEAKENYDHQHQAADPASPHLRGDLIEFVNFQYLANVARVNASVIATLASAPRAPSHPVLLTDRLEYPTRLVWDRNGEPDLAGYLVRYRRTSSPTWEGSLFTADTSITIHLSKDDYIFGVQAVDTSGNAGLAAVPVPKR